MTTEISDRQCPNGCEWEEGVPVLLNVNRDKWDHRDGFHCPQCLEKFRPSEVNP